MLLGEDEGIQASLSYHADHSDLLQRSQGPPGPWAALLTTAALGD